VPYCERPAAGGCIGVYVLVAVCILAGSVASPSVGAEADYVDRCALYSDGRVTRLARMPARVRLGVVPSGLAEEGYEEAFRAAAAMWEQATDGVVRCVFVNGGDGEADIPVRWVTKLSTFSTENRLAHTSLIRPTPATFRVTMEMGLYNRQTGKRLTYDEMVTASLHELGHAFGLWGHSPNPNDVMAAASEALAPTARDVATLRQLYAMPVDTSLHAVSLAALDLLLEAQPNSANLHYLRGSVLLDNARPDAAVDALLAATELNEEHSAAADKLIQVYLAAGRTQEAVTRLEAQGQSSPEDYNRAGIAWAGQGATAKAIVAFENALRIKPDFAVSRRNLARVYARRASELSEAGDNAGAADSLRAAIDNAPEEEGYGLQLASLYNAMGRPDDAVSAYQKVLERNPGNAKARSELAKTYNNIANARSQAGDFETALLNVEQALLHDPDLPEAHTNRKAMLWNRALTTSETNPGRALDLYRAYAEMYPAWWQAHSEIGRIYLEQRDYLRAIAAFEDAAALDPAATHNLALAHHRQGVLLQRAGSGEDAITHLKAAADLAPAVTDFYRTLGQAHRAAGHHEEAVSAFRAALAVDPELDWAGAEITKVSLSLGEAARQRGDWDEALRRFEEIPVERRVASVHAILGWLYLEVEDIPNAVDALGRAMIAAPSDAGSRQNLDFCLKEIKKIRRRDDAPVWGYVLQRVEAFRLASLIARRGRKADVARFEELLSGVADDDATVEALRVAADSIAEAIRPQLPEAADRIAAAAAARVAEQGSPADPHE
jgi:tetratricopeptide (TPR) repeat protein